MIKIPNSFLNENEHYLVIAKLKKFCLANNLQQFNIREDLIKEIYSFANLNIINKEIVLNWIDECLKEGTKHIYIRSIYSSPENIELLKNPEKCIELLGALYPECSQNYIIGGSHDKELKLQNYYLTYDQHNNVHTISFNFTILLLEGELKQKGNKFIYPIFIDIDLSNGQMIGRAKSKTKMFYKKNTNNDIIYDYDKITTQTIIKDAMNQLKNKFELNYTEKNEANSILKNNLYNLLQQYTFTPEEIRTKINSVTNKIDDFVKDILINLDIDLINNIENAKEDLDIFVEKYISINYDDQSIFTKDRDAYPIKLSSTDSEFTKIEETSADKEPLQHKEKFFDNKKSIDREQTCDGMTLCFNRIDPKYFGNDPYTVRLDISKGFCHIKLFQYVEEEDIKNVLSRIIPDSE